MIVGEHPKQEKNVEACPCDRPQAFMVTRERPGLLTKAVWSFLETTDGIPLTVFDDGSESPEKHSELDAVAKMGVCVTRLPHRGFIGMWRDVFEYARSFSPSRFDCVVTVEDDIVFARGWLDVLRNMQRGIADMGFGQGLVSCFRPHDVAQSKVVELRGIPAYQSMAHTWHCNMLPRSALDRRDVFDEAAVASGNSRRGLGIDVYYVGALAHRLGRVSFVSMQSWVRHEGMGKSLVEGQGFGPCRHCGFNLVPSLEKLR